MVLCVRNTLYGLKQSSDVCYGNNQAFVSLTRFVESRDDEGLLVLHNQDRDMVAGVVLYMHKLLNIANEGLIGQIKDQMMKTFQMHEVGSDSFGLGMKIESNWQHHTIDIHQHSYIRTILAKFRMDESRQVATPMAMKLHKRKPDEEGCDPTIYQ
jgi:hypothetical protein